MLIISNRAAQGLESITAYPELEYLDTRENKDGNAGWNNNNRKKRKSAHQVSLRLASRKGSVTAHMSLIC